MAKKKQNNIFLTGEDLIKNPNIYEIIKIFIGILLIKQKASII